MAKGSGSQASVPTQIYGVQLLPAGLSGRNKAAGGSSTKIALRIYGPDTPTQLLLKTPVECGLDRYLWTQQLIADLIQREFGVSYHHDHVGAILHEMGFTHQKPAKRARERDEAKIEAWRKVFWPELLKKTPPPTA